MQVQGWACRVQTHASTPARQHAGTSLHAAHALFQQTVYFCLLRRGEKSESESGNFPDKNRTSWRATRETIRRVGQDPPPPTPATVPAPTYDSGALL
ncbi:hypothetical protein E2C01_035151 [Portunus trituberculatus]|uniref:Uncharacterized protein n=1 Tax=Portunus trituberculatus TaxID=210409 RepID=A0A5B7F4X7_PORTR|nr:hypothetical protein [Portunus trituberculatus]